MAGFRELLAQTLEAIDEVDVAGAAAMLDEGARLLDVREPDEVAAGAIAGAVMIPRGLLETSVEARLPDRSEPIVVMCAAPSLA